MHLSQLNRTCSHILFLLLSGVFSLVLSAPYSCVILPSYSNRFLKFQVQGTYGRVFPHVLICRFFQFLLATLFVWNHRKCLGLFFLYFPGRTEQSQVFVAVCVRLCALVCTTHGMYTSYLALQTLLLMSTNFWKSLILHACHFNTHTFARAGAPRTVHYALGLRHPWLWLPLLLFALLEFAWNEQPSSNFSLIACAKYNYTRTRTHTCIEMLVALPVASGGG